MNLAPSNRQRFTRTPKASQTVAGASLKATTGYVFAKNADAGGIADHASGASASCHVARTVFDLFERL